VSDDPATNGPNCGWPRIEGVAVLREDRELLTDLKRVCNRAGQFALEYLADDLSTEAEEAYALRLIDIGERLLDRAKNRKGFDRDGEPTRFVVDAEVVRVEYEPRELPPGSEPGTGLGGSGS